MDRPGAIHRPHMNRRQFSMAALALTVAPQIHAQGYPERPIKLIYNFAPGGPGDAIARFLAQRLGDLVGQSVVVQNITGGAGSVGILSAARAEADGYTLLFAPLTGIVQAPFITGNESFDPFGSLAPVASVGSAPLALLARAGVPANDFPSFIEWARKQERGVDVAGAGAIVELATAVLARRTQAKLVWVGYRGVAPALQAVLAGDVNVAFVPPVGTLSEYLRAGKLKLLGVTSAQTSPLFPGAEPISTHVPGYAQEFDYALWAPMGVPRASLATLSAAIEKIMSQTDVGAFLEANGVVSRYLDGEQVAHILRQQNTEIREALAVTGVRLGG